MVDIVLASYNGEKYIEEQIRSIMAQSHRDWNLIIHDDGSSDNTLSIIKKLQKEDSRILLKEDYIRFGSPGANFLYALKYSNAEYVMFCDQDDIWFPHKIKKMIDYAKDWNNSIPTVVYSQSSAWCESGVIGKSTFYHPHMLNDFLYFNSGQQGCVSLFNAAMRQQMLRWEGEVAMHDHLLHMIGMTFGMVEYHQEPLMIYRQHNFNATGRAAVKKSGLKEIFRHYRFPVVERHHYNDWDKFVKIYDAELSNNNKILIREYLDMPNRHFISKLLSIYKNKFMLFGSKLRLSLKILFRPYIT